MAEFTFDVASHTYMLDGARLPSVTEIIRPIRQDFSMIGADVLEAKRALGTAVHMACEFDDLGELDDAETDSKIMGYVSAWRKFRDDTQSSVELNEQKLFHPYLKFAGTIDRVAFLRTDEDSKESLWLLDIKTSAEPHPSYGVQLSGYSILYGATIGEKYDCEIKRASVHLRADGSYKFHRYTNPNDEAVFYACRSLIAWKEANK